MSRLRVLASAFSCHSGASSGLGGGEDILGWSMVQQLARYHEVWAITYAVNKESLEQTLKDSPNPNLHFHYLDLPGFFRKLLKIQGGHQFYYFLWQIRAYFAARKLHKQVNFDVAHHVTYGNDWMVSFIGAFLPVPYIRGPGGGAHRTPKGFEKEYSFKGRLWEKGRSIGQWLFRHDPLYIRSQNRARAIMVCNQEAMDKVPAKWAHKVSFFPVNGITTEDLALTKAKVPQPESTGSFKVLSAGTLIRVKGFRLAIKAFKEFAANCPEASFEIVGSGPEEPHLRQQIEEAGLQSKVTLRPAVPRPELLAKMTESDVFLFPSLRDGGGAVVIEAMAASKPVVCLNTGGPGTHIKSEWGFKINPDFPRTATTELAQALELLYKDKQLRTSLGEAGRARAENGYHWDRLGDRLMDIYQKALQSNIRS